MIIEQLIIDVNDVWAGSKSINLGADSFDTISKVNRHIFINELFDACELQAILYALLYMHLTQRRLLTCNILHHPRAR
jgi:hypothetical protein